MKNEKIDIITNIQYLNGTHISLTLPHTSEPRIEIKKQLAKLMEEFPNKMIIIAVRFIGRRIMNKNLYDLNKHDRNKMIDLLDNRRHRLYYGIAYNNVRKNNLENSNNIASKKIHIKFIWHKLKHFSDIEREFLYQNFHDDIFETPNIENSAKFLIIQTGGAPLDNLIYRYNPGYYF